MADVADAVVAGTVAVLSAHLARGAVNLACCQAAVDVRLAVVLHPIEAVGWDAVSVRRTGTPAEGFHKAVSTRAVGGGITGLEIAAWRARSAAVVVDAATPAGATDTGLR